MFLTLHQEADREQGERVEGGSRMGSHLKESKEKEARPSSLITGPLINHPRFLSCIQLDHFPTPVEIPEVWIYSARSKSVSLITDKTEFMIQQISRLQRVTMAHFGKTAPVHFEYRFTALCHSNDVISLKEINAPLF